MIFVSYESSYKAYRAYDPITKRVHVTRDVIFNEQAQWDWGSGGNDGKPGGGNDSDDVFMVEYTTIGLAAPMADGADEPPTEESPLPTGAGDVEVDDDVNDENLDADHDDDAPLHFHSMSDILTMLGFAPHALVVEELHVVSSDRADIFCRGRAQPELEEGDDGGDGLHQGEWHLEPHRSLTWSQADWGEVGVQGEAGRA
jgi:hypothetical protein